MQAKYLTWQTIIINNGLGKQCLQNNWNGEQSKLYIWYDNQCD